MKRKTIPLTPNPGPRANSKPRPRYGVLLPSPWAMPFHVLVKVPGETMANGAEKVVWVPREFLDKAMM